MRRTLRQDAKERMREEYYDNMPTIEVDKQIDQLLDNPDGGPDSEEEIEDWNPPVREFVFQERARIVDAFYGPDTETLDGELALTRRIQVTKDMTALCRLWEPNRRGKRPLWDKNDDRDDETKQKDDPVPDLDEIKCPTDVCIVCLGSCNRSGRRPRKFRRIDSLRRHLMDQHLNRLAEGTAVHCTLETCKDEKVFVDIRVFLRHAATVHDYDLEIGPRYFNRRSRNSKTQVLGMDESSIPLSTDSTSDSATDSTSDSATDVITDATTDVTMSGTQTPPSSVGSDILHRIDPRLLTDQGRGWED